MGRVELQVWWPFITLILEVPQFAWLDHQSSQVNCIPRTQE